MDFRDMSAGEWAEHVRAGKVSSRELVQHALERIEAVDKTINAFVALDGDRALAAATVIDDRVARGEEVGPLAGLPLAVKDLEDAAGLPTTNGSAIYADRGPVAEDSAQVARLRAAGCVVIGKTNTPEFGWTGQTTNQLFGTTTNPWNTEHTPGGSSGGAAAALAAGMVPLATGSDGGGSIRIPAALCGLSGLKSSLGRVPHGGSAAPHWGNLSSRGPMAARVTDTALALDAVIGPDPTDLRSLPMPEPSWTGAVADPHVPRRIAWSPTLGYAEPDGEVKAICEQAVRMLEGMGAEIVEIPTVFAQDPGFSWYVITAVRNLRALGQYEGTEMWERIDPGLRGTVEAGKQFSAVQLATAEDECHYLNLRLVELFHDTRLLLCPTVAAAAPKIGGPGIINGVEDANWIRYTYPFNMTRSPAGTVCAGFTTAGLPVGLQVIGPQHADLAVLRCMAALETGLAIDRRAPV